MESTLPATTRWRQPDSLVVIMEPRTGVEPATVRLQGDCSTRLSYPGVCWPLPGRGSETVPILGEGLEGAGGVEPTSCRATTCRAEPLALRTPC